MKEPVYVICQENDDKTKFTIKRLKKFYEEIEVVTCEKLWKLDTVSGAFIMIIDPDEMEPGLLEEVVNRVNETYDEARSIVGMISVKYGVS